jgi:hypothetical protein
MAPKQLSSLFSNIRLRPKSFRVSFRMDWQEIIALSIVVATAAIFLGNRFRRKKFNFQRDTHCGCSNPGQSAPGSSIIFHARKGERGQIIMKMK